MTTTMTPTDEQAEALNRIVDWHKNASSPFGFGSKVFALGGYAGTGKTAMTPMIHDALGVPIRAVAPSWKAASVLSSKMKAANVPIQATSIHALIYNFKGTKHDEECQYDAVADIDCNMDCKELAFEYAPKETPGLLLVDEASMVDQWVRRDLEQLGIPIIYLGDHAQLPPVKGTSIFGEREPDYALQTIMRQGQDPSGLRIKDLAQIVRNRDNGWLRKAEELGVEIARPGQYQMAGAGHEVGSAVMLAYQNRIIDQQNRAVRHWLGRKSPLEAGDLVMTRDNDRRAGVFNGQVGRVQLVEAADFGYGEFAYMAEIRMDSGTTFRGRVQLGTSSLEGTQRTDGLMRISHAYACTTHKAQGSEYDTAVVTVPSPTSFRGGQFWPFLYTSITRAKSRLVLRVTA